MKSPSVVDEKTPVEIEVSYDTLEEETGIYISFIDPF